MVTSFKQIRKKALKNPAVRTEYDKLNLEYFFIKNSVSPE